MSMVGYQDNSSVPGGGYFIVRNSWSEAWAARSPEAAGHAMMPYAYVEQYVVEAFSGQAMANTPHSDKGEQRKETATANRPLTFEERYARTLRQDMRDVEGKLLQAGSLVICHPDSPEEVMEDTPANRARFKRLQFGWTDRAQRLSGTTSK